MKIRKYSENDVPAMIRIWNEVVEEGVAFPQLELLDKESGRAFFAAQTYCGVADDNGTVVGLYILHPNNVGRCGHIANASYAVDSACRGKHIGEQLVSDCLVQARNNGFKLMQFNAVVENNTHARHLYKRLGFVQVGMIPNPFLGHSWSLDLPSATTHKGIAEESGCTPQRRASAQFVEKVFFPPGCVTLPLLLRFALREALQAVAETAEKTYPPRTVRI